MHRLDRRIDLWCVYPDRIADPGLWDAYRGLLSPEEAQRLLDKPTGRADACRLDDVKKPPVSFAFAAASATMDGMADAPEAKRRWYRLTPDRLVVLLLAAEDSFAAVRLFPLVRLQSAQGLDGARQPRGGRADALADAPLVCRRAAFSAAGSNTASAR